MPSHATAPATATPAPPRQLIVVGAGGHAREVIWLAQEATEPWDVIGCLDDSQQLQGQMMGGVKVLGRISDWQAHPQASFIVAIGNPRVRRKIVSAMQAAGTPVFATLIHRSVMLSPRVQIGAGSMITAGCIVSTDVVIGQHVILNLACTVSHDGVLGDFATLAPQVALSGNVGLGQGAELGTHATVRQGLRIGRGAMAGMGAVVTRDLTDGELAVGSPARTLRQLEPF